MSALKKLNEARKVFHASKLKKTGHNSFSNYDYFELGDFLMPALLIFESLQLSGVVSFGKELATLTITDLEDESSQCVITSPMSTANLKACHEVQNLGAVETYLRRYLWVAALEIVEHDAIDASAGVDKLEKTAKQDHRISAPKEIAAAWAANAPAKRVAELDELALLLIDKWQAERGLEAAKLFYSLKDNEEAVYVWDQLKSESKLRTFLRANHPNQQKEAV